MNIRRFLFHDYMIAFFIFLLAFLVRVPFFWWPSSVVFDEGIIITFVSDILHHRPYFDVHPPLSNLLFSFIVKPFHFPFETYYAIGTQFQSRIFIPLRFLNVCLGSVLASIVFLLARRLWEKKAYAFLCALAIIFDNGLVVYSRHVLPENFLLFFGFLGILVLLRGIGAKKSFWFFLASFISLGAAVAIKWTALGFVLIGLLILYKEKKYREMFFILCTVFIIYLISFGLLFYAFAGGSLVSREGKTFQYPREIKEFILFLPKYTKAMYEANYTLKPHVLSSSPSLWPIGHKPMTLWREGEKSIALVPNLFAWLLALAGISIIFVDVLLKIIKREWRLIGIREVVILGGYAVSYIPFFFIGRHFFLYHYFSALIFSILAIPYLLDFFFSLVPKRKRIVFMIVLLMLCMGFFGFGKYVYGI